MVALLCLLSADGANAQPPARPFRETVSIAVDGEAARTLQILEDRWGNGRWPELVETLVELSEARGDRVVNFDPGAAGKTARYGLVQSACDRLIAALPPAGLAAYRRRIDPTAERWFRDWQKTGDAALLDRIVRQAYYSSWGDDALWELGQAAWDRGDFSAARTWWSQLLSEEAARREPRAAENAELPRTSQRHYPDPSQPAAEVAARCVLCFIFAGEDQPARDALQNFAERYGDAVGTLAGKNAPWRELLSETLEQSRSWPRPAMADEVPTFAGAAARTLVSPRTVDVGAELWSEALAPIRLPEVARITLFPPPLPLAYHPAVVDGRVFLNEGRRVLAWDLATGRPAWDDGDAASAMIYPAVADDLPQMPARAVSGGPSWTVTVADGRLFARMGSPVTTPSPHELRDLPNEIVCLDVAEGQGRLLWKKTGEDLSAALHEPAETPAWCWEGSPVANAGRVYAALSRRRPQLEWSIACLDAESGLLLWHRPVGISRPTPPEHENRASQLLLTLGDGRLFLSTDWGAIVAVDALEGRLQWAVTYESQPEVLPPAMPLPRNAPSPCVFAEGRLYVAPVDADRVFCLDGATGERLWQAAAGDRLLGAIGVSHGRFLVAGRSLWAFDAQTGDLKWHIRQVDPDDYGYGRGWLAGDVVYWTSRQALYVFDVRNGLPVRDRPLGATDQPRTGGNLVVAEGVLLIAGADRLTVYGRFARPRPQRPDVLSQRAKPFTIQRAEQLTGIPIALAVSRTETPERVPTASATPVYWKRSWRRTLQNDERPIVPESTSPASDHAIVLCQSRTVQAWDRTTGVVRWELPLDDALIWSAREAESLLLGTSTELCAVQPASGRVFWRCAWRSHLEDENRALQASVQFHRFQHGILIVEPAAGFVWCDERTGGVRFQQTFFDALQPLECVAAGDRLTLWSRRWGRAETWDFSTGMPHRSIATTALRWLTTPQPLDDGWVLTAEDRRLVWLSHSLRPQREFVSVAYASAEPYLVPWSLPSDRDTVVRDTCAIIDGQTLVGLRLDGERVWTKWSQPLARLPLTQPQTQTAVHYGRIYVAADGLLRALDLKTGKTAWEQPITIGDPARVVCRRHADDAPGLLAVVPAHSATTPVSHVTLFAAETGRPIQEIALSPPARTVALHTQPASLLIVTDREAIALMPAQ